MNLYDGVRVSNHPGPVQLDTGAELDHHGDRHRRLTDGVLRDRLRDVVFEDAEVAARNLRNRVAFVVEHRDVDVDDAGVGLETDVGRAFSFALLLSFEGIFGRLPGLSAGAGESGLPVLAFGSEAFGLGLATVSLPCPRGSCAAAPKIRPQAAMDATSQFFI